MNPWNRPNAAVAQAQGTAVDAGLRSYMLKVYNYMASGVLLTAIVSYFAGTSPAFQQMLITVGPDGGAQVSPLFWIIAFAPLAMVFFVLPRMARMSAQGAQMTFWAFAFIMGLASWSIFAVYTEASILRVLLITSGTFGLLSIYGYSTKRDVSALSSFIVVGILAVFVTSMLNVYVFKSSGLDLALSYLGVLLALGLTAWKTQEAKQIYYTHGRSGNAAIIAATDLYFAFVYLFMNLLRLLGDRR